MKFRIQILTALVAAFSLNTALALTLPVSEDSFASTRGKLTKASGKATALGIAPGHAAFIRFEVGAVSDSLPPVDVIRARLTFYVSMVTKPGGLTLHGVTGEWTESVATNTLQPVFESTPLATIPPEAIVAKQFVMVDVTTQVREWLANPASDFGFAILSGGTAKVLLGSKEGPGSGYPATLEIETNHSIDNDHLIPGIDASKLGLGNVDNIELSYLNGVNSAIQSQLDGVGISLSNFNLTLGDLQAQLNGVSTALSNTTNDLSGLSTTVGGKVSKAGDTMTGALFLPLDGFAIGINQLVASGGRIGIGTVNPGATLDVRGDIKLGPTSELFAPGGLENLRMVRGTVKFSGGVVSVETGTGFSVTHPAGTTYVITFSSAFSGPPTITTSAQYPGFAVSIAGLSSVSATGATILLSSELSPTYVHFIAVGPR